MIDSFGMPAKPVLLAKSVILAALLALSAGCRNDQAASDKASNAAKTDAVEQQTAETPQSAPKAETAANAAVDVVSIYNGAFPTEDVANATKLLTGIKNHGDYLMQKAGEDSRSDFVIEMVAPATIETLRFIGPKDGPSVLPESAEVAVGDSPSGDFKRIGSVRFEPDKDRGVGENAFDVSVPVSTKASGRFVRLSLFGKPENRTGNYNGMASFQASGHFDAVAETQKIGGVYHFQGDFGNDSSGSFYLVLHQKDNWVEGCAVATNLSLPLKPQRILNWVEGGIQNGVFHIERTDLPQGKKRSGILSVSSDGKWAHAAFFNEWADPSIYGSADRATGERVADEPVECVTHDTPAQSASERIEDTLEKDKVIQLYGINFDLDSDVLRPESSAVLDQIVTVAKKQPEWRFEVAGHTDSSGSPAHNLDLSQRRAASVVRYLAQAGVDASRLTAKGYGAEKPLMPNTSAAGMAQNRRVELIKQ